MYRRKVLLLVLLISISLLVFGPISNTPTYAQTVEAYYPSAYNLFGATAKVSGTLTDLQSDDGVYMTFRSYGTATAGQALYAHQETTTIAGTPYYLQKLESADGPATSLSVSMASTGRQLLGKFVYPLTGVTSIPASTWTVYYRTWASLPPGVSTNSPSSVPAGTWTDPTNAYASNNSYATTATNGATQEYGNYGFSIPGTAVITKVEVGYEAYTAGNEKIGITLSWDNGTTWATEIVSANLPPTDPNNVTWVDFTGATSWTPDKLSNANFRTRAKAVKTGGMKTVYLDWIPVKVTYTMPSFVAHADVDISVRRSNGTIRTSIATNVANSGALTTTAATLSGTYSWPGYTVVDQTDYLEIDYYIDVTTAQPNATAYLRIDDNALPPADQTRATNIILPSEYTVEVEFTGSSDMYNWTQLVWIIDSAWTTGSVSVTLQLYNYALGAYPTSGDGYIAYTSSATPNTDETKSQTITTNPTSFRDASGNWKVKIKGVKATTAPFDFKADLIKYETTTVALSDVAVFSVTPSATEAYPTWTMPLDISVVVVNEGALNETFYVTVYYNKTATEWMMIGNQTVTNLAGGENKTLTFSWNLTGVSPGNYTIRAEASILPGEVDTADNSLTSTVKIKVPGDADGDGHVQLSDLTILALNWYKPVIDPRADFTGDGGVTLADLTILALNWYKI